MNDLLDAREVFPDSFWYSLEVWNVGIGDDANFSKPCPLLRLV